MIGVSGGREIMEEHLLMDHRDFPGWRFLGKRAVEAIASQEITAGTEIKIRKYHLPGP